MNKAQIIGALNAVLDKDELAKAENAYGKLLSHHQAGHFHSGNVARVERLIAKAIKVDSWDVRLLDGADGFGLEVYGEYNRFDIMEYLDDNVINQVAALWRHWEDGAGEFWLAYEDKGE